MAAEENSGSKYITNYEFEVQFGTDIRLSFSKISNISSATEYEVIADGGNNSRMSFAEKAKRRPDTISFQKGIMQDAGSEVLSWLVEGLKINEIMIIVKKEGEIKNIFFIEQGVITNITFSDLNALSAELMIKTMELQHTGLVQHKIMN